MRSHKTIVARWLLGLSLLVLVLALVFWLIRPSPYGEWLGLAGLGQITPLYVIVEWANRRVGPTTPLGLLSQFPSDDLLIAAALLIAIGIVLVLLWNSRRGDQAGSTLTRRIRLIWPRGMSLRVRTVLVLIAIVALDLGWEVVGWRAWRLRQSYVERAGDIIVRRKFYDGSLRHVRAELAQLEAGHWLFGDAMNYTTEAKAAILAFDRDRLTREASDYSALIEYYNDKLLVKYEAAAEDPLRPIVPDPPPREILPEDDPNFCLGTGNYERALLGFDKLVRLYPDYPATHERRAWLLATCPLATIRNGKLAVIEARRACELTNWKALWYFSTLAAAHAEIGDFDGAVSWEQKARNGSNHHFGPDKDPLTLYKTGKPVRLPLPPGYRMPPSAESKGSPTSPKGR
jgi:tetratricopeptide (TPR) repeat protein